MAHAQLDEAWTSVGPHDHPLAPLYRRAAEKILTQATARSRAGIRFGETLTVTLAGHRISVPIDEVQTTPRGFVIRRLRTGRPPKKPDQRPLHALMAEAGRQALGPDGRFEVHYLAADKTVAVSLTQVMNGRLEDVQAALQDLQVGRFAADPKQPEDCPRCPHYFICPVIPE